MRKFILNIGHARKGLPNITNLDVLKALTKVGFVVYSAEVFESDSEPTSVVVVEQIDQLNGINGYIRQLATATSQEVISALHIDTRKGRMLGATIDLDDAWGDFNPELFIMPDGSRLARPVKAAA